MAPILLNRETHATCNIVAGVVPTMNLGPEPDSHQASTLVPRVSDSIFLIDGSRINAGWWFQTFFIFHFIYGMSSFPLTNSIIFQRGRSTTNQIYK